MYAVFIEVNADGSQMEAAREYLPKTAAPMAKANGAKAGYWLGPLGGRGVSMMIFDSEEKAREIASMFHVGEPPGQQSPSGVTVRTVEVREVLAGF